LLSLPAILLPLPSHPAQDENLLDGSLDAGGPHAPHVELRAVVLLPLQKVVGVPIPDTEVTAEAAHDLVNRLRAEALERRGARAQKDLLRRVAKRIAAVDLSGSEASKL
jgi:hypothetical protein